MDFLIPQIGNVNIFEAAFIVFGVVGAVFAVLEELSLHRDSKNIGHDTTLSARQREIQQVTIAPVIRLLHIVLLAVLLIIYIGVRGATMEPTPSQETIGYLISAFGWMLLPLFFLWVLIRNRQNKSKFAKLIREEEEERAIEE
jgi:TRAP-type C4-dicarboxylate transport system permease small subunit